MKNIFKTIAFTAVAVLAVSCNKAEFKTTSYVCFDSSRAMMPEACGIYKIPVTVHNTKAATITFRAVDGSAVKGVDYTIVNAAGIEDPSGVLNITNGCDTIYVKVTDRTGELTKNLTFSLVLSESVTEGVVLGATKLVACTIIDADAGINLLIGSWYGTGTSPKGEATDLAFDLDVLDPDTEIGQEGLQYYPDANIVLYNLKLNNSDMDSQDGVYIYACFDENTSQIRIYNNQFYNVYNFGDQVGVCYVALATDSQSDDETIDFLVGDNEIELVTPCRTWLYSYETGEPNGYYYASTSYTTLTMTKQE